MFYSLFLFLCVITYGRSFLLSVEAPRVLSGQMGVDWKGAKGKLQEYYKVPESVCKSWMVERIHSYESQ